MAESLGLTNLYDEPGGNVIGQVTAPYRVTVQEVTMRCTGDFERYGDVADCPGIESSVNRDFLAATIGNAAPEEDRRLAGTWARVTTSSGQEGWMLLEVAGVGI